MNARPAVTAGPVHGGGPSVAAAYAHARIVPGSAVSATGAAFIGVLPVAVPVPVSVLLSVLISVLLILVFSLALVFALATGLHGWHGGGCGHFGGAGCLWGLSESLEDC